MAEAMAAGIPPHELMHYTPRELVAAFAGHRKRQLWELKVSRQLAWHTANYGRYGRKKLPSLTSELHRIEPPKEMSAQELRNAILEAHKRLGGNVRVVPKGTISGS